MSTIPRRKLEKIQWLQQHLEVWDSAPENIGLTLAQVQALTEALSAAQTTVLAADAAREASQAATLEQDSALAELDEIGGQMVAVIKAFANASEDPNAVYAEANLSPRRASTPQPAPETPSGASFTLRTDGSIRATWDGSPKRGKSFVVQRRATFAAADGGFSVSAWASLGTTGETFFDDTSVPAGAASVEYQIKAIRGDKQSPWCDPITVRFSAEDGEATELRLAA